MDVITEISLEALIQRATDPRNSSADTAAIDAFCGIIKKEPDGALVATKLIASKIQSSQEWEALQGLSVLEACMKNCGPAFHSEIGKFRFLNEMIKLVSPKFLGSRTPPPVRNQVLKMMHSWTLNYPKEPKIKEAYDMLKKQGVINVNEVEIVNEQAKTITPQKPHPLFQDEEKARLLQKLLHSKNPDDLQAANRLIKTMVKEDERRIEMKSKKVNELETIRNNVRLLGEMLDSYKTNQASAEEIELIKELHSGCERLRPSVFKIAADIQDNDEILTQVLSVSDELGHVLDKYTSIMLLGKTVDNINHSCEDSKHISSLLDFNSPSEECVPQNQRNTNSDIFTEPLSVLDLDIDLPVSNDKASEAFNNTKKTNSHLGTLDEIFASLSSQSPVLPIHSANANNCVEAKPLEKSKNTNQERTNKMKAFEDLDILGETMLQKCKLDSGLLPLNSTKECTNIPKSEITYENPDTHRGLETSDDDPMMDLGIPTTVTKIETDGAILSKSVEKQEEQYNVQEVKPLTDVFVSLESMKPSSIPPIVVIEEKSGISVTLHIAKDTPREDVSVLIITTVSRNPSTVKNYLFQAVIPKGCKLKLQPPSGSELPPYNPFLPPSAITQIMLIANPNKLDVTLKCMISFTVDDETITEMGEVERLPIVT